MKKWNIHTRLSCFVLAIVMVFALTGCGETGNDTSNDTETTAPVATEATETIAVAETEAIETVETEATEESTGAEPEQQETLPDKSEQTETKPAHGEDNKEPETTEPPVTEETEPAHKHDYTKTVTKPTCTEKGYTTFKCNCGDTYTANEVAATGHDYKAEVVAPTASAQGYTLHTCKVCGDSYKDNYTDKLPVETQPEETEPDGCQHNWQEIHHDEVGHEEWFVVCKCGYRCKTSAEWGTHVDSYSLEDALLYHTSNASSKDYVVDTPAYTEWICSNCGSATTTKP